MDVLYILGRGSKHDDMELRLSLRCLEKNARGVDRVFIVGNCPDWVQNVTHIPAEDTWTAENNAFQKILKACRSDISDEFLLMNDDFFMIESFSTNYEYFSKGKLEKREKNDPYSLSINKTFDFVKRYNKTPNNFEVHCPFRINKHRALLLEGIAEYFKKQDTGILFRSLYGNVFDFWFREVEDTKIYDDVWREVGPTRCISTSDDCDNILKRIEEMYPNKSRWEK